MKLSLVDKTIKFLKNNPNIKFTAREIAKNIISLYPEDYIEKRKNPRFKNENEFISQIVAEIGASKNNIIKQNSNISWRDKPRPRVYWFEETKENSSPKQKNCPKVSEYELYPILIDYLSSSLNLYCMRIDEKRSKNSYGAGGNSWLHPDIVAMETIDKKWHKLVKSCIKYGNGQSVRLWSFEVKKELDSSNVRKSFFQAVSNSSWANEGYLVATKISNDKVEQELRMLSALHGIGIIILDIKRPLKSEILLPAKSKVNVDWESVNRIVEENKDFRNYIELVSMYYQTGIIREQDWNK